MLIRIFGLTSSPVCWSTNRTPLAGGTELVLALKAALKTRDQLNFFVNERRVEKFTVTELQTMTEGQPLDVVAKPNTTNRTATPDSRLYMMTETGPDAGRSVPLSRRATTVGRANAKVQIRDPWLSSRDFRVLLTNNGIDITEDSGAQIYLGPSGEMTRGTTQFSFHRGSGLPLTPPRDPGDFRLHTPQPPTRPNMVLQIIGAAAPLLIGLVLMMMTGMWYFLLFSGISVIIAIVLISQYHRSRRRFIGHIRRALETEQHRRQRAVHRPSQFVVALSSRQPDPFGCQAEQPEVPVLNVGTAQCEASLNSVQDPEPWRSYLCGRTPIILRLSLGSMTFITGDATRRRPLKNWCIAQVLRHIQATKTGAIIDGQRFGGTALVTVADKISLDHAAQTHQLIFCEHLPGDISDSVNHINLDALTIRGDQDGTDFDPLGVSSQTLALIRNALGIDIPAFGGHGQELSTPTGRQCASSVTTLPTTLGNGPLGKTLDLVQDGPHILITGTTGSGKSELLLTVLAGLVMHHPPVEVGFILLDFKGGSSFNVLAGLPHTMSVETNHVAAHSLRSLTAIQAELLRREMLFAQYGVADYMTFRNRNPQQVLPRLVVAIDELRVLVEQHPDAAATLAHLAATGRSLGFHLIMATQRSQGAVTSDIKANIGTILALRTATEHDSWDVLGTADAYQISAAHPGRAFFKSGADDPVEFQTARYVLADEPLTLERLDNGQNIAPQPTNWPALSQHIWETFNTAPLPDPVLLPALPERLTATSISEVKYDPCETLLGVADDPTQCRQYPVLLSTLQLPGRAGQTLNGSLAFIGVADSGIEDALVHVISQVRKTDLPAVFFDGHPTATKYSYFSCYANHQDSSAEALKGHLEWLENQLGQQREVHVVISDWAAWQNASVSGSYQVFEDHLAKIIRQYPQNLRVYVFGGRELAACRLIGLIPDRIYLPKNSSAEHQLLWPSLKAVPSYRGRGILVSAQMPTGGVELQLVSPV